MSVIVKAIQDKETKGTFRYSIEENDYGVSGSLYLNKEIYDKKPPKKLKIKFPNLNSKEK